MKLHDRHVCPRYHLNLRHYGVGQGKVARQLEYQAPNRILIAPLEENSQGGL